MALKTIKTTMKNYLLPAVIVAVVLAAVFVGSVKDSGDSLSGVNCTVTTTKVSVGNQGTTTVLAAGIKDWAIIQQPIAATNTVTLNIGGTAVSGTGYILASSSITVGTQQLVLGQKAGIPASDAVQAITNLGSSTVNVIVCK